MDTVPLSALQVGQRGTIVAVHGALGRPDMEVRLLEMGLVPGTVLRVIKRAPLGDPLEFQVRGYHLSLRKTEAQIVEVRPDEPGPSEVASS